MPKYWHIPTELEVKGMKFTSTNRRGEDSRSWYSDSASDFNEHFTVAPTNAGQDDFTKFHLSIEFYPGRNAGIYYVDGVYSHPPRLSNFTESEREAWNEWYDDSENIDWLEGLGQGFWAEAKAKAEEYERSRAEGT